MAESSESSLPPAIRRSAFQLEESWWVDYDELELFDKVSAGATAQVYEGEYRGMEVAVKILNSELINVEKLQGEFRMITQIHSPHVVAYYGLCLEPKLCVVMELCRKGTLEEVLRNNSTVLDWKRFFHLANGLARGVNLLHSWRPQIIHREISPRNLLLTDDWTIKFCDFGRARYNNKGDEALKTATLDSGIQNVAYTAPEVYMDGEYSGKTDIYSVGIVLWELAIRVFSGVHDIPFQDLIDQNLNSYQILRKTCMQGLRPPFPAGFPASLKSLIERCWAHEGEKRPTAKELVREMLGLKNNWEENPEAWPIKEPSDDEAQTPRNAKPKKKKGKKKEPAKSRSSSSAAGEEEEEAEAGGEKPVTPRVSEAEKEAEEKIRKAMQDEIDKRIKEEEKRIKEQLENEYKQKQQAMQQLKTTQKRIAEVDPKDVKIRNIIGKGAFGEVWRGTLHGKDVAIKKLFVSAGLEDEALKDFRNEVEIMITLRHPNICLLMGACTQPGNLMIIMEFMSNGSVESLLHSASKPRFLSFDQKMKMGKDCALGMNWLHRMDPPFLHLDLKPANLLVDDNFNVKVADFGLSKLQGEDDDMEAGGSPFYMAPEVLLGREVNEKADVYSFGVCLWEIYTRQTPYKDQFEDEEELKMAVCDDEERPPIPADCPELLAKLIRSCWAADPQDRPSFQQILEDRRFEKILVDNAVADPKARDFWTKYFLTEETPEWLEFWTCLVSFLKIPLARVLSENDPRLAMFRNALLLPDREPGSKPRVSRSTFDKFTRYFGPLEVGMIDRLADLASKKWFHGDLSKKKAEEMLLKTKRNGAWLVRYATRPGDFVISVMGYKRKRATFVHHIVTAFDSGEPGKYMLLETLSVNASGDGEGGPTNLALEKERDECIKALVAKPDAEYFASVGSIIRDKKKYLGIAKLSKFVPYPLSSAPVQMPRMGGDSGKSKIGHRLTRSLDVRE